MQRITALAGSRAGQAMWVLAAGPSLKGIPLEDVPREDAIACNSAFAVCRAKYALMVDPDIWKHYGLSVVSANSCLIASDNLYWPLVKGKFDDDRVYTFNPKLKAAPGTSVNGIIHEGRITGYYASEIAAMMVGKGGTVLIAGMDLEYTPGGATHAAHKDGKVDGSSSHPFFDGLRALCRLRDALLGVVEFRIVGRSALLSHGFEPI
jgi:hypothetical protein